MTQSATFGAVLGSGATGSQVRTGLNLSDEAAATDHEGTSAPSVTYPFMRWRNNTAKLVYRRNAANTAWDIIENYGAGADPTVNDDAADGYIRGSVWINTTGDRIFWCAEAAAGAAVWQGSSGGGGVSSVFGRTGTVVATAGDYTADKISDGGGKVIMTSAERSALAAVTPPAMVITLNGTNSNSDNANIRAALATILASGQPGELHMSGNFKIGYSGDKTGIDPGAIPYLKLKGRGYCRWYKGLAATTSGVAAGDDPADGSAYALLARGNDDGPSVRKTLIIEDMIFEGDLATTMRHLGDDSRLISLNFYERVELINVEGRWSSQMLFTVNDSNIVRASRIYLHHGARDGFNVSNSVDVSCVDSDFEWIVDDCFAANLDASNADDLGQQRGALFANNRVYNCQGVKFLGSKNVLIYGNSFRAPLNYAVYVGDDESFGQGARPIEDVLVYGNNITDLVNPDLVLNENYVNTAILVSQFTSSPRNVVVRLNNIAQRTATTGKSWSELKLRGIEGENRLWREDPDGNMEWGDDALDSEVFVGSGRCIRVEASNALDRIQFDIDDNRQLNFGSDEIVRWQPSPWSGNQAWAVPASATEFPVGAPARITGVDLRGYVDLALYLGVGTSAGLLDTVLSWRYSLDGGSTWTDTGASITLDGSTTSDMYWGEFVAMPDELRQGVDITLALWGSGGNGSTQVRITDFHAAVRNVDQTTAARLLPRQVLPAEKTVPGTVTALRSFSPKDISDIAGTGGGGSTMAFGSIAVAGQSNVVADAAPDTLTLAAGANITITTNASTDTVTIAAAGGGSTQAFGTIAVAGQSDVVADAAPDTLTLAGSNGLAITTATDTVTFAPTYGSSANTVCQGNDSRLSDTRTPTAHATSHKSGGGDAINVTEFGGFTTGKLAGRTTAGSGALEAITPSANLSLAGGTLDVTGPVASALGLTGAVSVNALTEDTAPDRAADFVVTYDTSAGGHKKVKPQNLIPYDILCGIVGKPSNGEVVLLFVAPRAFRIPANAAGSYLKAGTAATGSSVFSIQKNGAQFLTATVAGSGTTATFASSQTDFAAGDVLKVVAPATADATLADIAITLAATLL